MTILGTYYETRASKVIFLKFGEDEVGREAVKCNSINSRHAKNESHLGGCMVGAELPTKWKTFV